LQFGGRAGSIFLDECSSCLPVAELSQFAVIQVGGEGEIANAGETVGDGFGLGVEAPPFLNDNQPRPGAAAAGGRFCQITGNCTKFSGCAHITSCCIE